MVFLVAAVSVLVKNLTAFFIVESLIDRYILLASTDDIFTLSLFIFSFSSLSFRSDAWTMKKRE